MPSSTHHTAMTHSTTSILTQASGMFLLCILLNTSHGLCFSYLYSGGARVFAARANVFVAAPTPAIRSPTDILMVTTMALVWTVNSTLSWGCNYVMQWILGWSVATAKMKTAAHTFRTCLCWNKIMYITLFSIQQKWPNFRIPYFCPSKCRLLHSAARGRCTPFPPPLYSMPGDSCSFVKISSNLWIFCLCWQLAGVMHSVLNGSSMRESVWSFTKHLLAR